MSLPPSLHPDDLSHLLHAHGHRMRDAGRVIAAVAGHGSDAHTSELVAVDCAARACKRILAASLRTVAAVRRDELAGVRLSPGGTTRRRKLTAREMFGASPRPARDDPSMGFSTETHNHTNTPRRRAAATAMTKPSAQVVASMRDDARIAAIEFLNLILGTGPDASRAWDTVRHEAAARCAEPCPSDRLGPQTVRKPLLLACLRRHCGIVIVDTDMVGFDGVTPLAARDCRGFEARVRGAGAQWCAPVAAAQMESRAARRRARHHHHRGSRNTSDGTADGRSDDRRGSQLSLSSASATGSNGSDGSGDGDDHGSGSSSRQQHRRGGNSRKGRGQSTTRHRRRVRMHRHRDRSSSPSRVSTHGRRPGAGRSEADEAAAALDAYALRCADPLTPVAHPGLVDPDAAASVLARRCAARAAGRAASLWWARRARRHHQHHHQQHQGQQQKQQQRGEALTGSGSMARTTTTADAEDRRESAALAKALAHVDMWGCARDLCEWVLLAGGGHDPGLPRHFTGEHLPMSLALPAALVTLGEYARVATAVETAQRVLTAVHGASHPCHIQLRLAAGRAHQAEMRPRNALMEYRSALDLLGSALGSRSGGVGSVGGGGGMLSNVHAGSTLATTTTTMAHHGLDDSAMLSSSTAGVLPTALGMSSMSMRFAHRRRGPGNNKLHDGSVMLDESAGNRSGLDASMSRGVAQMTQQQQLSMSAVSASAGPAYASAAGGLDAHPAASELLLRSGLAEAESDQPARAIHSLERCLAGIEARTRATGHADETTLTVAVAAHLALADVLISRSELLLSIDHAVRGLACISRCFPQAADVSTPAGRASARSLWSSRDHAVRQLALVAVTMGTDDPAVDRLQDAVDAAREDLEGTRDAGGTAADEDSAMMTLVQCVTHLVYFKFRRMPDTDYAVLARHIRAQAAVDVDPEAAACATAQLTRDAPVAAFFDTVAELWLEDGDDFAAEMVRFMADQVARLGAFDLVGFFVDRGVF